MASTPSSSSGSDFEPDSASSSDAYTPASTASDSCAVSPLPLVLGSESDDDAADDSVAQTPQSSPNVGGGADARDSDDDADDDADDTPLADKSGLSNASNEYVKDDWIVLSDEEDDDAGAVSGSASSDDDEEEEAEPVEYHASGRPKRKNAGKPPDRFIESEYMAKRMREAYLASGDLDETANLVADLRDDVRKSAVRREDIATDAEVAMQRKALRTKIAAWERAFADLTKRIRDEGATLDKKALAKLKREIRNTANKTADLHQELVLLQ